MQSYLANRWVKISLGLVVLGWGPLIAIIALAALHLWPDPDPNPVGPGLLFFVTFWPAVICFGVGAAQVARQRRTSPFTVTETSSSAAATNAQNAEWMSHPAVRTIAGIVGLVLIVKGVTGIQHGGGRGAASAIVLGGAALYWTVMGRLPRR
jgi:hypothetical protein